MAPQTRYARSGDLSIAYQVVGDGPFDLVLVHGWVSNIDLQWDEPHLSKFLGRLASFSRLITFDKRGTGLSDRVPVNELPTLEQRMDDLRAVMDAAGSEQAALFGVSEGGALCLLFAATHPERVRAVLTFGSYARRVWSPDYPWAPTPEKREAEYAEILATWGTGTGIETVFPSMVDNPQFREWIAGYFRGSASPAAAVALLRMNTQADIRSVLPTIRVPALVMNRIEDGDVKSDEARFIASRIPGAGLKLFPGADHVPWVGQTEEILGEIEEFLTGARHSHPGDRVLATILSTDIVESTELVARLGDQTWRDLLDRHHTMIRRELKHYQGREIDTAGDGFFAAFDGPARAIRCAKAVIDEAEGLRIEIRAGLHTGECEVLDGKLTGIAVHTAARVASAAAPGEVLVSSTVRDLVAGSGISFVERGERSLKGLPERLRLFAVQSA
ncbi:MAG: adenylate/guanylate cyclase domain-containing protein [Gemmatimonadetes bacterium 13_1_40CM_4_65_7]|nr:MAG: adenylate/guanylate cyclase domain-containing protein [Gemmatimonadetes bacterium 13_1_40CM_4_65_7]